ncbi:bifunctional 5,10-methylenetetrahydrofolate dehydrogenase/5,10-methenyltetrahydrofolate cyclohydrolase [Candidatus Gottesmanbacteria bacterium]|nr:bifunctional 5,10-methylenetetrahydrofolate dehydrogenase/5,10-methenyltetrahydrofolate cyclohydrolase [Candidatus Gottesmanbacteria bacterium]
MKIDGKAIADRILNTLADKVVVLKNRGIVPTLAVIQVGDNPSSTTYILQKKKAADRIGARIIHTKFPTDVTVDEINKTIERYNNDVSIHGLIVQHPLPDTLGKSIVLHSAILSKDVDGFLQKSPYPVPVAQAVLTILEEVFKGEKEKGNVNEVSFEVWLKNQPVAVLGRGETAGKPIFTSLENRGCATSLIHSQTPDPSEVTKKMTIVVSCVGKERVITKEMVTPKTILIGVGLWRDRGGKLRGDYNEGEIKDVVAYYTPTPGGVGPVNVSCLMQNVLLASSSSTYYRS